VDNELEVIREQMHNTSASLADKLETLETQVRGMVGTASETVSEVAGTVKEVVGNVTETVENVAETFNISKQVERHPWPAVGVALGVGLLSGYLLGPSSRRESSTYTPTSYSPPIPEPAPSPVYPVASEPATEYRAPEPQKPGMWDEIVGTAGKTLREVGIGALFGALRLAVQNAIGPPLRDELTNMMEKWNSEMGGRPIWEDISKLTESFQNLQSEQHSGEQQQHSGGGQSRTPDANRGQDRFRAIG